MADDGTGKGDGRITDGYLPIHLYGVVETLLLDEAPEMAGPILPPSEIEERGHSTLLASAVDVCVRNLTHRFPDGPTFICIVKSLTANALVARFRHFQCIIISQFVYTLFMEISGELLRGEVIRTFLIDNIDVDDSQQVGTCSRREALLGMLRDEQHQVALADEVVEWAALLGFFMMYFLAAHEIGHLALGHLQSRWAPDHLLIENGALDGHGNAQSRALEWEADVFAGLATVWYLGSTPLHDEWWKRFVPDLEAGLRIFAVGAYLFFTAMDIESDPATSTADRTHPAPLIRVSIMAVAVSGILASWGNITQEAAFEIVRRAIRAVELAIFERGGGIMDPAEAMSLGDRAATVLDEVHATLAEMRGELDRTRLAGYFWGSVLDEI